MVMNGWNHSSFTFTAFQGSFKWRWDYLSILLSMDSVQTFSITKCCYKYFFEFVSWYIKANISYIYSHTYIYISGHRLCTSFQSRGNANWFPFIPRLYGDIIDI